MVRLAPSALLPALVSALLASLAQSVDLREEYRVERAFTARGEGGTHCMRSLGLIGDVYLVMHTGIHSAWWHLAKSSPTYPPQGEMA